MVNKRLLIKNLLSHYDENSFYDKKRQLNLDSKIGKAKFIKHICALSNSNPENNSYLIIGVEDEDNKINGVDFFDDSKIQNLVDAYLENPPQIVYENVLFPSLPSGRVVGLVTIRGKKEISRFKKTIQNIEKNTAFYRKGSNSQPMSNKDTPNSNKEIVESIENMSKNNLNTILESVLSFMTETHKDINPRYQVFKENFIVCWAGHKTKVRGRSYYSRVDIELINEQVRLFYSALDAVTIYYNQDTFVVTEYVKLGLNDRTSFYAFEEVVFKFHDNGSYEMKNKVLFQPPQYNANMLQYIYSNNLKLFSKLQTHTPLTEADLKKITRLPHMLMICYLNGFEDAKRKLTQLDPLVKKLENPKIYRSYKEVMRILRKLKYENENIE